VTSSSKIWKGLSVYDWKIRQTWLLVGIIMREMAMPVKAGVGYTS
jgi:hypothetical protein